jgi:LCP family protein required for cell wall assembly
MASISEQEPQPSSRGGVLKYALLAVFLIAAILTGVITFRIVRDFVTSWELTSLPGVTLREAPATPDPASGPVTDLNTPLQQSSDAPPPVMWDGASRITMLVMGLDYRDWAAGDGPPRTDTMILLTIDPLSKTAGMLSIPRDLWVNVPGYQYDRINTAFRTGEVFKHPGGGPGLAMETVEELLGVPIDFYAQIDFGAFVRFIDEIGGVKLNIPEKVKVDPLGDNNTKTLKPGVQTLNGELALAYARLRKGEGDDFGRAERQQAVIMGIRDRLINPKILPVLIGKSGVLYNELSAGVHTNMTLDQAIKLAWLAVQVKEENIQKGVIAPPEMVLLASTATGDQILKPITEKIRQLRDEIFASSQSASPVAASLDPAARMKAENARISVLNGTSTPGLAANTAEYLKSQGVNVTVADNATAVLPYTEITFYNGKPYTVQFLVDLFKIDKIRIYYVNDPTQPVDAVVILGQDWAGSNPLP